MQLLPTKYTHTVSVVFALPYTLMNPLLTPQNDRYIIPMYHHNLNARVSVLFVCIFVFVFVFCFVSVLILLFILFFVLLLLVARCSC